MKFTMTYLILFFMTILLAVPRFLFHTGKAEAGFHSQTEFTIGTYTDKSYSENTGPKYLNDENDFAEPQPEFEEWMKDPEEWNLSVQKPVNEKMDTAMSGYENKNDVRLFGFTLLNL